MTYRDVLLLSTKAWLTSDADECERPEGHLISVAALEISTNFLLLALAIPLLFQTGIRSLKSPPEILLVVFVLAAVSI